jgi:UDPglucose 6-dehydrogenase
VATGRPPLRVCVLGLGHLGTVTAACLASSGHQAVGLDFDAGNVGRLGQGLAPMSEPGLERLIRRGLSDGALSFTTDVHKAVESIDVLWVAYDTPVDDHDRADVRFVLERIDRVIPSLRHSVLVLISSQLPAGSTAALERRYQPPAGTPGVRWAYSPENLRLGRAIADFMESDRIVVGIREDRDRALLESLFGPFTNRIEWMSVESAEMTKHALNGFLANSVAFINEIAVICERLGADAAEVERGLKSDARIGDKAYLSPGAAFAGGTLARDLSFLEDIAAEHNFTAHLLRAVRASNDNHRQWASRRISAVLGGLSGLVIAVWGLTYKSGADTLRRSSSIEFCEWLIRNGARVHAHDPAIKALPAALAAGICLSGTPLEALRGASALVVSTSWPEYAAISATDIVTQMPSGVILDPARALAEEVAENPGIRYFTVGRP